MEAGIWAVVDGMVAGVTGWTSNSFKYLARQVDQQCGGAINRIEDGSGAVILIIVIDHPAPFQRLA